MATWRDVRRYALALPGTTEEQTSSGNAAWIVNKKFFTWERPLRPADVAALGDAAEVETVGPLVLKGYSQPVPAFSLKRLGP